MTRTLVEKILVRVNAVMARSNKTELLIPVGKETIELRLAAMKAIDEIIPPSHVAYIFKTDQIAISVYNIKR